MYDGMNDDEPKAPAHLTASDSGTPLPQQHNQLPNAPLFQLGQVVATPGALAALEEYEVAPITLLNRHRYGDWGDLDAEDRNANNAALVHGSRILSAYLLKRNDAGKAVTQRIWIITEADRSSTCLLLPEEY
ncbi:hypothetical protein [Rhodoferax sp. GW822-FHT02A01]|uniref:hypothetical protein n=1 Tax=Rhodoferax sp. GW822-FHT02A01 TaxID=3141537 RepID=UPI00315D097A